MAAKEAYQLTRGAEERALAWFEAQRTAYPGSFGNGRAARALLGEMKSRLGAWLIDAGDGIDESELSIFRAQDVPEVPLALQSENCPGRN